MRLKLDLCLLLALFCGLAVAKSGRSAEKDVTDYKVEDDSTGDQEAIDAETFFNSLKIQNDPNEVYTLVSPDGEQDVDLSMDTSRQFGFPPYYPPYGYPPYWPPPYGPRPPFPPGTFPPGTFPPGTFPPGTFPPGNNPPGNNPPGHHPPGHHPPGHHPPGHHPPGHHPPGHNPPGHHPPGHHHHYPVYPIPYPVYPVYGWGPYPYPKPPKDDDKPTRPKQENTFCKKVYPFGTVCFKNTIDSD